MLTRIRAGLRADDAWALIPLAIIVVGACLL